jgi:thiamine-phosphate pyrophosphorylase
MITNRRALPHRNSNSDPTDIRSHITRALNSGVDLVQIREPDISARDLVELTRGLSPLAGRVGAGLLVNDRVDVAAASEAGVHLTTRSLSAETVRRVFGAEMLIGVSTHTSEEAVKAEHGGADFIVFGPVFATESKRIYGSPVGLGALGSVTRKLGIPVFALGGITTSNFVFALDAGAAGVAGISIFIDADRIESVVAAVKGHRSPVQERRTGQSR